MILVVGGIGRTKIRSDRRGKPARAGVGDGAAIWILAVIVDWLAPRIPQWPSEQLWWRTESPKTTHMAEMSYPGYAGASERITERFHMDKRFLKILTPPPVRGRRSDLRRTG